MKHSIQTIFLFIASALWLCGCASTWQTTYAASRATAQFIDTTHDTVWSVPLRERIVYCDPRAGNVEIHTQKQFEECLGTFANNRKVEEALHAYNTAAAVLAEVLLQTDPKHPDRKKILVAWLPTLQAAKDLLEIFPEGEKYVTHLTNILKGLN